MQSISDIPDLNLIPIYSNSKSDYLDQELMLFSLCHHPPTKKLFWGQLGPKTNTDWLLAMTSC